MKLEYSSGSFGEYIANHPMKEQIAGLTEKDIHENFHGFIVGVDAAALRKLNETLAIPIDIAAFENGEFALIATDNPEWFSNVTELNISLSHRREKDNAGNLNISLPLGGFVPFGYRGVGSGLAPTVLVSNTLMYQWFSEPVISRISLDVSDACMQNTLAALKKIIGNDYKISLTSKLETMEELNGAKTVLLVLGGGISFVVALIGILNFVCDDGQCHPSKA